MTQAFNAPKELSCPVMTIYPVKRGSGEAYPAVRHSSVPKVTGNYLPALSLDSMVTIQATNVV